MGSRRAVRLFSARDELCLWQTLTHDINKYACFKCRLFGLCKSFSVENRRVNETILFLLNNILKDRKYKFNLLHTTHKHTGDVHECVLHTFGHRRMEGGFAYRSSKCSIWKSLLSITDGFMCDTYSETCIWNCAHEADASKGRRKLDEDITELNGLLELMHTAPV